VSARAYFAEIIAPKSIILHGVVFVFGFIANSWAVFRGMGAVRAGPSCAWLTCPGVGEEVVALRVPPSPDPYSLSRLEEVFSETQGIKRAGP
jgi:hypothetical protein